MSDNKKRKEKGREDDNVDDVNKKMKAAEKKEKKAADKEKKATEKEKKVTDKEKKVTDKEKKVTDKGKRKAEEDNGADKAATVYAPAKIFEMIKSKKFKKLQASNYQIDGVAFMLRQELRTDNAKGGIIADDMGLGKTVQTIMTCHVNYKGPTLIVCEKMCIDQWKTEFKKFTGQAPSVYESNCMSMSKLPPDTGVVITTYPTLRSKKYAGASKF
jgi:SNF2 family DNA or RNA helicase